MPDAFAFTRLPDPSRQKLTLDFEGVAIEASVGDSVAAAVLAAGHRLTRTTPVGGSGRGPYCMMGVCFDCLMEIDGEQNRQACMVEARDGMKVRRMRGARPLAEARA